MGLRFADPSCFVRNIPSSSSELDLHIEKVFCPPDTWVLRHPVRLAEFSVNFFYSATPLALSYHGQCSSLPLLPLSLYSFCVAGRVCLAKLTGEVGNDLNKTTAKKCGPLPACFSYEFGILSQLKCYPFESSSASISHFIFGGFFLHSLL
jgi:hypothetical protein